MTAVQDGRKWFLRCPSSKTIFIEGRNLAFLVLCNETQLVGLLIFTVQMYVSLLENIEQPNYVYWSTTQVSLLSFYF